MKNDNNNRYEVGNKFTRNYKVYVGMRVFSSLLILSTFAIIM